MNIIKKNKDLFDAIEDYVDKEGCDRTTHQRDSFLDTFLSPEISERMKALFDATGGYCLCETLFNSMDVIDLDEDISCGGEQLVRTIKNRINHEMRVVNRYLDILANNTDERTPYHDLNFILDVIEEQFKLLKNIFPTMLGNKKTYLEIPWDTTENTIDDNSKGEKEEF